MNKLSKAISAAKQALDDETINNEVIALFETRTCRRCDKPIAHARPDKARKGLPFNWSNYCDACLRKAVAAFERDLAVLSGNKP